MVKYVKLDYKRNRFLSTIISSIQMKKDDFLSNLLNGYKYEQKIYEWSLDLFEEGLNVEEAIEIIYGRRMLILSNDSLINQPNRTIIVNHQKVMFALDNLPIYSNLTNSEKEKLQLSIDAVISTNLYLYPEIIAMTVSIIKNKFLNNKSRLGKDYG